MTTTITIKDQVHEVYFGLMALEIFVKEQGAIDEGSVLHVGQITSLLWAGLKNAAFRNHQSLTLSFTEVADAVEQKYYSEEGQKELVGITNAFADSQAVKQQQTTEVKKKKR